MKKITLLTLVSALLVACSSTQTKTAKSSCAIQGKDCWEIAQLLNQTKEIALDTVENQGEDVWTHPVKYENASLAALNLEVTHHMMYRDGGSTVDILNDKVSFFTNRRLGKNPQRGYVTVTFKETGKKFVFDEKGKLVK